MLKKILIVDDSPVAIRILKVCLPPELDVEFMEAKNGAEGLECFKRFKPDLTFLDLTMPVMDGFEALEEMLKVDNKALVIIVSADVQKQVVDRVMSLGAFLMVYKPPSRNTIQAAVNKAVAKMQEMRVS